MTAPSPPSGKVTHLISDMIGLIAGTPIAGMLAVTFVLGTGKIGFAASSTACLIVGYAVIGAVAVIIDDSSLR